MSIDLSAESPETELAVIRTLWHEPESRKYFPRVFPQMFSSKMLGYTAGIFREMHDKGEPYDERFFAEKVKGKLTPLESVEVTLPFTPLSQDAFVWAVEHLRELYFSRVAIRVARKMEVYAKNGERHSVVRSALALESVNSVLFSKKPGDSHFALAVNRINSSEEVIPTCFTKLNNLIGGWTRKDVSSVGGKSGHFKTTFTLFDAIEALKRSYYKKLLYISVDEPGEMIARRVIASQMKISLTAMRQKKVVLDAGEVSGFMGSLFGERFQIRDDLNNADIIKEAICDIKPDRVIIDHIQELDFGEEGISDQKVMVSAKKFKAASKIANCNVTILSQVRDKMVDERFDNKIPRPHDFLYGSDLRRKSREQAVVYWEFKDTQKDVDFPFFDFIVWKSTYSETGKLRLVVNPEYGVFAEREVKREIIHKPTSDEENWADLSKV